MHRVVFDHAHVNHLAAQAREQTKGGVAVAVIHRAFARRLAQREDFVAGRKVSHAQWPKAGQGGQTQRRGQAQAGRRDPLAPAQSRVAQGHVFAAQAAVVAWLERTGRYRNQTGLAVNQADHFLRHHGVHACRHDGAGHDLHALTGTRLAGPGLPGQRGAHDLQLQGCIRAQLPAVKGIAVHGRVVMRRHVQR